ncbi:MAG: nitrate reductase NapE [Flavobacteriales bacterium]|jgi:nitrate reductase NapE
MDKHDTPKKSTEVSAFLFITVVPFPMLAVALVGSYGLIIWVSQMIFGPPVA